MVPLHRLDCPKAQKAIYRPHKFNPQGRFLFPSRSQSSIEPAPREVSYLSPGHIRGTPYVLVIYRRPQTNHPRTLLSSLLSPSLLPGLTTQGKRARLLKAGGNLAYRLAVTISLARFFFTYVNNHTRGKRLKAPQTLLEAILRLSNQLQYLWLPRPKAP